MTSAGYQPPCYGVHLEGGDSYLIKLYMTAGRIPETNNAFNLPSTLEPTLTVYSTPVSSGTLLKNTTVCYHAGFSQGFSRKKGHSNGHLLVEATHPRSGPGVEGGTRSWTISCWQMGRRRFTQKDSDQSVYDINHKMEYGRARIISESK